jgi:isopentenyl phosphate kinase
MNKLTFIKLGGSTITDKRGQESANLPVIQRLAAELATARHASPALPLLIGHGSGSFGHYYASHYHVHEGVSPGGDWLGFALTAGAALRLNRIVVDALLQAGLAALSLQPSASLHSHARTILSWDTSTIVQALLHGLIPVIHGDVAFDTAQGCTIVSTEDLFAHLALHTPLSPTRIILVGDSAVYTADPRSTPDAEPIGLITSENIDHVRHLVGQSYGHDVTGGMRSKIDTMWSLIEQGPHLTIDLISSAPGALQEALLHDDIAPEGTRLCWQKIS